MPRLSIYLPDDLLARAKEIGAEANMSQVVQSALRRLLGETTGPDYAQRPAGAREGLKAAREALAPAAQAEYQSGYESGLRRLPDVPWSVLDDFADHDFDLTRWLEGLRRGVAYTAAVGDVGEPWLWKLAEDLGDVVNPIGFDQFSFHKTRAFRRGYGAVLRDAYAAVEHGTEPSAGDAAPTGNSADIYETPASGDRSADLA